MNLRVILWTLGLAYVAFLLVGGKDVSSLNMIMMVEVLIGGAIGCALGILFTRRAHRRQA